MMETEGVEMDEIIPEKSNLDLNEIHRLLINRVVDILYEVMELLIIVRLLKYETMDTIQAYGMIGKDMEKLTTQTELSMDREHTTNHEGQGEINYKDGTKYKGYWDGKMVVLRDMDKELYTLQMDKYSTKASGTKTSIKAKINA